MKAFRKAPQLFILLLTISSFTFCRYKGTTDSTGRHVVTPPHPAETKPDTTPWLKPSKGIRGILEDRNGNLWFSSTDFVCMFDGSAFTYFTEADGLCGIGGVQEEYNGPIWIQSGSEVCSYDGKAFTSYPLRPGDTGNTWETSLHDLWFHKEIKRVGRTEGPPGVYRYHDGRFTFLAFPVPQSANANSLYMGTTGAVKARNGTLWFGTFEAAFGFDGKSFTIIDREKMGLQYDPHNIGIRALYESQNGDLWIGDNGNGIFVYDGDTVINFTRLHRLDKGATGGNTLHRIFSIAEDDTGNMWFGTVYSGIWRYNPSAEQEGRNPFTNYTKKDGVNSAVIWTIYKTRKGELLFAGEDPGAVYRFNGTAFDRVY
ncbi:MAG: hypothetical protein EP344_13265 [Bacteroidetes bacterium]|nr:MAG: hypothetical protein EP344_13265 [Bacteroidota bacterium]